MDQENRVVVLIDMDCFYCQVEEKLNPELKGKPIAVVQYNPWKGGGIIAVNYVARAMGVTRHMRGDEAKEKCPAIQLPSVPCQRGKADITKYREAGKEVAKVLQNFTPLLERASIDEAYLDITAPVQKRLETLNVQTLTSDSMPNTFALGYDSIEDFISEVQHYGSDSIEFDYNHAKLLLVGAFIVSEIRAAVYEQTGFRCSAGIAHNKILAKLVCGMNKPNKQTVLPKHSINIMYRTLGIKKVKHLGGKFGDNVCDILKIKTMAELQQFPEKELQSKFDEKNGSWLFKIARGIDLEPVQARFNPKSIGCCKQFRGKAAIVNLDTLSKWLKDLGDEIDDRLEKDALENNRTPKQMVVSYSLQLLDGKDSSSSRSYNFSPDDELCGIFFSNKALELLMDSVGGCKPKGGDNDRRLKAPIKFLGISVGKFEDHNETKKTRKILDYFNAGSSKETQQVNENSANIKDKSNENNDYILRKYLIDSRDGKHSNNIKQECGVYDSDHPMPLESTLEKQESFFAKFFNTNQKNDLKEQSHKKIVESNNNFSRADTPECNVFAHGDNSNDTDYSGSTINEEINKSIALFDEDPDEVARVSNMRQLLNKSKEFKIENNIEFLNIKSPTQSRSVHSISPTLNPKSHTVSIDCSECGKTIPVKEFDEHVDYHLALRLREEELQEVRKARESNMVKDHKQDLKKKKPVLEELSNKNESISSIANFLTKIGDGVPTKFCSECGKKVVEAKYMEHQDFHEAQRLSRQLNKPTTGVSTTAKRKRKSTSPIKKPKVQCKSIDLFFR